MVLQIFDLNSNLIEFYFKYLSFSYQTNEWWKTFERVLHVHNSSFKSVRLPLSIVLSVGRL